MRRVISLVTIFGVICTGIGAQSAYATTVTAISCPSGGGTYSVEDGRVTGTTGTCSGDLVLDNSVTALGNYAFGSAQITSLTIPESVTAIDGAPFSIAGAQNLESITVETGNPNFSSEGGILFNKDKTELITYPGSKVGSSYVTPGSTMQIRFYAFSVNQNLTSIDISSTVTIIGGGAFYGAQLLETVTIGTGLSDLGEQAFMSNSKLRAINVDSENPNFRSIDGVLYNKAITTLWAYPIGKTATSFVAPNTVVQTKYSVFASSPHLINVDISSVNLLSGQEFLGATLLETVIFGNGLEALVSQVLTSAPALREITLGTGLTTISDGAFSSNDAFAKVNYCGTLRAVQEFAFPRGKFASCDSAAATTAAARVDALITALPEVGSITTANTTDIASARVIFGRLNGSAAALVTTLSTLVAAEAKLVSLTTAAPSDDTPEVTAEEVVRLAEAVRVAARSELLSQSTAAITLEQFARAGITGINAKNLDAVNAEIAALPAERRGEIIKIARKFEVVDILSTSMRINASMLQEIGLITSDNKNRSSIASALAKLPHSERASFAVIERAIATVMKKIQDRKDRLAAIKVRIAARSSFARS